MNIGMGIVLHNYMRFIILPVILCGLALPLYGQYSARQEGDVVRLEDAKNQTIVSVMPGRQ